MSSYFDPILSFGPQVESPLSPGSDTSTLLDFDPTSPSSNPVDTKSLPSPTETVDGFDSIAQRFEVALRTQAPPTYLQRIEKVLSDELNPFDLVDLHDLEDSAEHGVQTTRSTGVVSSPAASMNMQAGNNEYMISSNHATHQQEPKSEAFYDPSSADGYGDPNQNSFLSASAALTASLSSHTAPAPAVTFNQSNFLRDSGLNPSPSSSPHIEAASPHVHHRTLSHGSEGVSPAPFSQEHTPDINIANSLGQLGQISLNDENQYAPVFDDGLETASNHSFHSQQSSPDPRSSLAAAAYSSLASASPASGSNDSSGGAPTSSHQQLGTGSTPQLSLGIPSVSVSDTSMDYTPIAPIVDSNMPSINVMAPSPSTPKAGGRDGQGGGFQDILAQLAASQNPNSGAMGPIHENKSGADTWSQPQQLEGFSQEPLSYASPAAVSNESLDGSALKYTNNQNMWPPSPHLDPLNRPQSASGRIVPEGYTTEPSQMLSSLAGTQSKSSVHAPGQWSSQAKRQDSYDKIRQFLRLDVDMGFQGNSKNESPTLASFRKRANSDVGPRSPVAAGGGGSTAFDWSLAMSQNAAKSTDEMAAWDSFKSKDGTQGLYSDNDAFVNSLMATFQGPNALQSNTMDPSLLAYSQQQSQQQSQHPSIALQQQQGLQFLDQTNPAFGTSGHLNAQYMLQQGQMQQQHQPTFSFSGPGGTAGFPAQLNQPSSGEFNAQWKFPGDNSQNSGIGGSGGKSRRASSGRPGSSGGHRRLAQSEDLSRSRLYQGVDENFLSRITAPNGGLAPPSSGRSVSSSNGAGSPSFHSVTGSARVHPYRANHDRHHSFSSNASNSSTGSASPMPAMGGAIQYDASGQYSYSQTALPIYGDLNAAARSTSSVSSMASGGASGVAAPPVPVVTSQATQAASASRRKAEALFACPVPGCGSTFTRQYNLRGHLRSHNDERPFKCSWPGCDKSFARSHDCKRHENLHLDIKPHTCEQCGKTFARLDALNRHHKSDTGGCSMKSESESQTNSSASASASDRSDAPGQVANAATEQATDSKKSGKGFGGHVL